MRQRLRRHGQFQRHGRHDQKIERSVLAVGRQQPVERKQAREQGADPEHGGTDALEQRQIGPHGKGRERHHDQKEKTAIDAPPPARNAMRMSRMKRADERVHAGPIRNSRMLSMAMSAMGRGDDHPAFGEMLAHQNEQRRLRARVERGERFIEQPDRPRDRNQPCKRQAAVFAPPRDKTPASASDGVEADRFPARRGIAAAKFCTTKPCAPEFEILDHRKRGFERVLMAEIMRLFADAAVRVAAGERQRAAFDPQQPRDHAQQRGFARAIAAGHRQRLVRTRAQNEPGKDLAPAAPADQGLAPQGQRISHRAGPGRGRVIGNFRHAGRLSLSFVHMERLKKGPITRSLHRFSRRNRRAEHRVRESV